ncbi:MAG: hypothetical protein ACRDNZ_06260 [Streptosporangiaceae bacterium]
MTIEEARDLLSKLLWDVPKIKSDDSRKSIVDEMRRRKVDLGSPTLDGPLQCIEIISSALAQRGGLQKLAELLEWVDRTPMAQAFANTVEELLPTDLLLLDERVTLFTELGSHVPQKKLMLYYAEATSGPYQDTVAEPPERFTDLESLVCELEQIPSGEPGHPLIRLTEWIAEQATKKKIAKSARRWSDVLAARFDEDSAGPGTGAERQYLAERRRPRRTLPTPRAEGGQATLVLKLERSGPRPDAYFLLTAWLYLGRDFKKTVYSNDDPIELQMMMRNVLIGVLEEAHKAARQFDPDRRRVDLEFAVPRSMLCFPFEKWTFAESPYSLLAKRFVVVVRDLERQRRLIQYAGWEDRWTHLAENGNASQDGVIRWITCDDPVAPGDLFDHFDRENVGVLGLTFPARNSPHYFDLTEMLDAGTPIAVWPHWCKDMPIDPGNGTPIGLAFKEELHRRLHGRPITDLPKIVMEMRRDYSGPAQEWAGLTLLWDDPWRWPEPEDFNLRVPEPMA